MWREIKTLALLCAGLETRPSASPKESHSRRVQQDMVLSTTGEIIFLPVRSALCEMTAFYKSSKTVVRGRGGSGDGGSSTSSAALLRFLHPRSLPRESPSARHSIVCEQQSVGVARYSGVFVLLPGAFFGSSLLQLWVPLHHSASSPCADSSVLRALVRRRRSLSRRRVGISVTGRRPNSWRRPPGNRLPLRPFTATSPLIRA